MDFQILTVLLIVAGSIILFVSEKFPVDMVAMMVLVALLLTGLVEEDMILNGFSNPATITVAGMFILSAALQRTGVVRFLANKIYAVAGKSKTRLNLVLMSTCGTLSAFINNTATVAVLLPLAMRFSDERGISPSRILMPLSFAAQFGGVCTLIGTTTNLLMNLFLIGAGLEPFGMFEFAKFGLICFAVGIVYMLFASKYMLKDREQTESLSEDYRLQDYMTEMRVLKGSPLIGQRGQDNALTEIGGRIIEMVRDGKIVWAAHNSTIHEGDLLVIRGDVDRILESESRLKLEDWAKGHLNASHLESDDISLLEVIVPTGSPIVGRTLTQLDFYWRYHAAVLGVRRRGSVLKTRIRDITFKEGDTLLVQGHKNDLLHLADDAEFAYLQDLSTLKLKTSKAFLSVVILASVVGAAAIGTVSILTAALCGALAVGFTKCLTAKEIYNAVDLRVILLLAGLIPLGAAMESSGAVSSLVDIVMASLGSYGPIYGLGGIYILTMVLTAVMSNNATAVLIAPLALQVANSFGADPKPFLIAVTFAASTCFATPVGYQTNTMVYGPGGYKYIDFLKVGLPLNIIFFILAMVFLPLIWPL
ncbi:MAG: SLC13 family permease [Alphaproteobacteria bacterium]|nr:SLC13 family permease [Alphaproteobacteria bacterium]